MTTYAVTVPAGLGTSISVSYRGNPPTVYPITANQVTVDERDLTDFLHIIPGSYLTGGPVPDTSLSYLPRTEAAATYAALAGAAFTGAVSVGGAVTPSSYAGGIGPAKLQVTGNVDFFKTSYEHKIANDWAGQNTLAIQNKNNSDSYSAVRFLHYQGAEAAAIGYGNPGTAADLPFAGAAYFETSTAVAADGSQVLGVAARPIRIVQSGVIATVQGTYCRQEFASDGSVWFMNLNSQFSLVTRQSRFRPDGRLQLGPTTSTTLPVVNLDCVGPALFGTAVDTGRPSNFTATADFCISTYHAAVEHLRFVRQNVAKMDFLMNSGPARMTLRDADNSKDVVHFYIDGTQNVGLVGGTSFGGGVGVVAVANRTTLPASTPTGGGLLYSDAGAGKWKGSSGTVTTFGPAEPHCPDCGRDFALEWESESYGYLALCMWCMTDGLTRGVMARREVAC